MMKLMKNALWELTKEVIIKRRGINEQKLNKTKNTYTDI